MGHKYITDDDWKKMRHLMLTEGYDKNPGDYPGESAKIYKNLSEPAKKRFDILENRVADFKSMEAWEEVKNRPKKRAPSVDFGIVFEPIIGKKPRILK